MSKKISLSIAEPCHENWDNMSPDAKGKFCGSCQKQVIDFSHMNDWQLAEFFKKPSTGSVCGRFMSDQLEKEIEIPKKRIPWVKYFFQLALPAFFFSKASSQHIKMGKIMRPPTKDTIKVPEPKLLGMVAPVDFVKPVCSDTTDITIKGEIAVANTASINGKVVDEKGSAIVNAVIFIKGTSISAVTKSNGTFSILHQNNFDKIVLVVSGIGYQSKEMMVDLRKYNPKNEIILSIPMARYEIMGALVSTHVVKTKTVIEKNPEILLDADNKSLIVFPNPVLAGSSLHIKCKKFEEGDYSVQLLNFAGQLVFGKEIWIEKESKLLTMDIPFIAAGNYFLLFTNKKTKKKMTEKVIIQ